MPSLLVILSSLMPKSATTLTITLQSLSAPASKRVGASRRTNSLSVAFIFSSISLFIKGYMVSLSI